MSKGKEVSFFFRRRHRGLAIKLWDNYSKTISGLVHLHFAYPWFKT